jgi:glycosyltransferase involved in cell wall biosynthesis
MDISIVIPVYNEREALPALYHAMAEALDRLPQSAEIIFLDDGSNGGSADIFDGFAETDERVQVLHYSETMARRPR